MLKTGRIGFKRKKTTTVEPECCRECLLSIKGAKPYNTLSKAYKSKGKRAFFKPDDSGKDWFVLLEYLGYTRITKTFADRINKAKIGNYFKGYAWIKRKKTLIAVHQYF